MKMFRPKSSATSPGSIIQPKTTIPPSPNPWLGQDTEYGNPFISEKKENANPPFEYLVRPGENLYRLSQKFGVSVEAIKQHNGLPSEAIRAGQRLEIPVAGHQVRPGENLFRLSQHYGVSVERLMEANDLGSEAIQAGAYLAIPGVPAASSPVNTTYTPPEKENNPALNEPELQALLRQSQTTVYRIQPGDDLWRIAYHFWSAYGAMYNQESYTRLVGEVVARIKTLNGWEQNAGGQVAGFQANLDIMIVVPGITFPSSEKQTPPSAKKTITHKEKPPSVAAKQKILSDEQSTSIGHKLNMGGALLEVCKLLIKHLGSKNAGVLYIMGELGVSVAETVKIKIAIDLYDGRYRGKFRNLIFDALSLVVGKNPYGAILLGLASYLGIDADVFFKYCDEQGISLPKVGEIKSIKGKPGGPDIHYYQFDMDLFEFNNQPAPDKKRE